ncbi:hypothetical protein L323_16345 [Ruminiclostridium papyrosolvens C7]|uniref:Uncharacterized protein n=1 Tax=Ruminiclostridium papyrosolvens C7 TaxID=1330534 RepID=U4QZ69_9FIRM|nr:hypothetical protein L323_16345 [Ruminiclostridium papyrosolvens C7]
MPLYKKEVYFERLYADFHIKGGVSFYVFVGCLRVYFEKYKISNWRNSDERKKIAFCGEE